jgi:hypothetical protein
MNKSLHSKQTRPCLSEWIQQSVDQLNSQEFKYTRRQKIKNLARKKWTTRLIRRTTQYNRLVSHRLNTGNAGFDMGPPALLYLSPFSDFLDIIDEHDALLGKC